MQNNNSNGSRAASARGAALGIVLVMGLGLMARPAEAAPFAYVANENSNTVSVIDTATNTVVATVPGPAGVSSGPDGVAVTPDGKRAYIANVGTGNISVIDTATTMVGTPGGEFPRRSRRRPGWETRLCREF